MMTYDDAIHDPSRARSYSYNHERYALDSTQKSWPINPKYDLNYYNWFFFKAVHIMNNFMIIQ